MKVTKNKDYIEIKFLNLIFKLDNQISMYVSEFEITINKYTTKFINEIKETYEFNDTFVLFELELIYDYLIRSIYWGKFTKKHPSIYCLNSFERMIDQMIRFNKFLNGKEEANR